MKKIAGIYKITNPKGAVYIGQSWDIESRLTDYCSLKCKRQPKLYNSLKKYGVDNHTFKVLNYYKGNDQFVLNHLENFYWAIIKHKATMLNIMEPKGSCGKHSHATKLKMRMSALGKPKSELAKRNMRKPKSEEHKLKISLAKIGKDSPTKGMKLRPLSESHKEKIRQGVYKTLSNEAVRKKISESKKGVNHPNVKLISKEVLEIRRLLNDGSLIGEVAKKFNLKLSHIYKIRRREIWKHI